MIIAWLNLADMIRAGNHSHDHMLRVCQKRRSNVRSNYRYLVISVDLYWKTCHPTHQQMTLFWKRICLSLPLCLFLFCHFCRALFGKVNTTAFADVLDLLIHLQNKSIGFQLCTVANYNNVLWKIFYNFIL
jgi:hypothetical protein